ncbi:MAG: hypothetical protein ABMA15_21865 [Vicinamibacterales bacterium]
MREVRAAGFGYKRLILIDGHPEGWPETGFQLGAMHVARDYEGALTIESLKIRMSTSAI